TQAMLAQQGLGPGRVFGRQWWFQSLRVIGWAIGASHTGLINERLQFQGDLLVRRAQRHRQNGEGLAQRDRKYLALGWGARPINAAKVVRAPFGLQVIE